MIKIGIVGYGNLGKGVHCAVNNSPDMELVGIFTRRDPEKLVTLDKNFNKVYMYNKNCLLT